MAGVEAALAVWLASGVGRRGAVGLLWVLLPVFVVVGVAAMVVGESGGCFGGVSVPAWLVLAFNVLGLMALWMTGDATSGTGGVRRLSWVVVAAFSMAAAGVVSFASVGLVRWGSTTWVDVFEVRGEWLTLLDHVVPPIRQDDRDGLVVLVREGCERCDLLKSRLATASGRADVLGADVGSDRVWLVDVDGRGKGHGVRPGISVMVSTPQVVEVRQGRWLDRVVIP